MTRDVNEILNAINIIDDFLDTQGELLATSMWRAKDGTILSTDWGYFEEGMRAIEKYLKGGEECPRYGDDCDGDKK